MRMQEVTVQYWAHHTTSIPFQFLVLTIPIPITDKDDLLCFLLTVAVVFFLFFVILLVLVSLVIDFD